jgi:hypothetical protein
MTEAENPPLSVVPGAGVPLEQVLFEIKRLIVGQDRLVERLLVGLLAQGHVLIEGVPGIAKTATVKALAQVVGVSFGRVQFTPDLVPADLIGTRVFDPKHATFTTELGPVFTSLLLADEINRAPAKVQSALLEVMQEHQVTIGKQTFPTPEPFMVLATQNLPAARGAGRPVHAQDPGRLPVGGRGDRGRVADDRPAHPAQAGAERGAAEADAGGGGRRLRRPGRAGLCGAPHHRDPDAGGERPG